MEHCAFCAGSDAKKQRRNLSAILCHGGQLCIFLRTVWPALWKQLLTSLRAVYVCHSCFQNLDTGANRFSSLQQSIATLEQLSLPSQYSISFSYCIETGYLVIHQTDERRDNDKYASMEVPYSKSSFQLIHYLGEQGKTERFPTTHRQANEHILSAEKGVWRRPAQR